MTYVQNELNVARRYRAFALVDAVTGLVTPAQLGLTFSGSEIQVAKNNVVLDAANSAGVLEVSDGQYIYPYTQGELGALGVVGIRVAKAGCRVVVAFDRVQVADVGSSFVLGETVAELRYKPFYLVDAATGLVGQGGLTFSGAEIKTAKNETDFGNAANSAGVLPVSTWGAYLYPYSVGDFDTEGVIGIEIAKAGCAPVSDSDPVRPAVATGVTVTLAANTEADAIEAIAQRWAAAWPVVQPTVSYALGNEALPTSGLASFVSLTFGALQSKQITQGNAPNRIFERRGTVIVKAFGAVDAGERPLALLMDSVRAVLEAQLIGSSSPPLPQLQTYAASDTPPTKQGSWYVKAAMVPFTFYGRA